MTKSSYLELHSAHFGGGQLECRFWLVLLGQEKASLALTWLVDVGWISVGTQVFPGLKTLLHLEMLFPCFGLGGKMFFFLRRSTGAGRDGINALGFQQFGFRPYSLRRGGATFWLQQHGSFDKLLMQGRWASQKTARIYINEELALLADLKLPW